MITGNLNRCNVPKLNRLRSVLDALVGTKDFKMDLTRKVEPNEFEDSTNFDLVRSVQPDNTTLG